MIDETERASVTQHAYIPEHLPDYVTAISGTEPYLIENYLVHVKASNLIFVGYPLGDEGNENNMLDVYRNVKARFNPALISVIAPKISPDLFPCSPSPKDAYYRLTLANLAINKKTRNMLRRAEREVCIRFGKFGREHHKLIKAFLRSSKFDKGSSFIFQRVSQYTACETVKIYEARNTRGDLVAFDVADFGSKAYAFYMFNFRSHKFEVPGVSDLLLMKIIEGAQEARKTYLNLGLGINPGVTFFKQKWGGTPFLEHTACELGSRMGGHWLEILDQIRGN